MHFVLRQLQPNASVQTQTKLALPNCSISPVKVPIHPQAKIQEYGSSLSSMLEDKHRDNKPSANGKKKLHGTEDKIVTSQSITLVEE